jgi:hypothetical protein
LKSKNRQEYSDKPQELVKILAGRVFINKTSRTQCPGCEQRGKVALRGSGEQGADFLPPGRRFLEKKRNEYFSPGTPFFFEGFFIIKTIPGSRDFNFGFVFQNE